MTVTFVVEKTKTGISFSKVAGHVLSGALDLGAYYRAPEGIVQVNLLGDAAKVDAFFSMIVKRGEPVTPQDGPVTLYVQGSKRDEVFAAGRTVTLEPVTEKLTAEEENRIVFGDGPLGQLLQDNLRPPPENKTGLAGALTKLFILGVFLWTLSPYLPSLLKAIGQKLGHQ